MYMAACGCPYTQARARGFAPSWLSHFSPYAIGGLGLCQDFCPWRKNEGAAALRFNAVALTLHAFFRINNQS
jgi:hypothetical protein